LQGSKTVFNKKACTLKVKSAESLSIKETKAFYSCYNCMSKRKCKGKCKKAISRRLFIIALSRYYGWLSSNIVKIPEVTIVSFRK